MVVTITKTTYTIQAEKTIAILLYTSPMTTNPHITELQRLKNKVRIFGFLDTVVEVFILFVVFLSIQYFFISPFIVSGASMEGNLHDQEIILVNRFGFSKFLFSQMGQLHRGDVIVFRPPSDTSEYFIKRIIGVPGDTLQFKDNLIYLNGEQLHEKYVNCSVSGETPTEPGMLPCQYGNVTDGLIVVPEGRFFVMGDNRNASADSRVCFQKIPLKTCTGDSPSMFVPYGNIVGKAVSVFWPLNSDAVKKKSGNAHFLEAFWPVNNLRGIDRFDPAQTVTHDE